MFPFHFIFSSNRFLMGTTFGWAAQGRDEVRGTNRWEIRPLPGLGEMRAFFHVLVVASLHVLAADNPLHSLPS